MKPATVPHKAPLPAPDRLQRITGSRAVRFIFFVALTVGAVLAGVLWMMGHDAATAVLRVTAGLGMAGVSMLNPAYGLYIFVAAVCTEGLLMFGPASAARLAGMVLLASWLAHSLIGGRFRITLPRQAWIAAALVVWGLISIFWTAEPQKLRAALLLQSQLLALYIVVTNLPLTVKDVRNVAVVLVITSLAVALAELVRLGQGVLIEGRAGLNRLFGADVSVLAAYLLPPATCLMVMSADSKRPLRKATTLAAFSLVALAIMSTGSRAALLALSTVMLLGVLADRRLWQAAIPALVAFGSTFLLLPHTFADRVQSIVTLSDRAAGRIDIWLVGLRMVRARPLLGTGLGSFETAFDVYLPAVPGALESVGSGRAAHNTFLHVQGELGVIGLLLLMALISGSLKDGITTMVALRRAEAHDLGSVAVAMWLSLVGILIVGLFFDIEHWKLFWLLLALIEVVRRLSEDVRRGETRP